ncbi:MAG: amino acid ABC transporter permease [Bordetella sp.]|uniref:amino acid ABC transporter permease n=1 Tax=Bordetella sp. TaxID=28081 RepID=UPI003F7C0F9E
MTTFTQWDILRGLLLGARWTAALSLATFAGSAILGMALLLARTSRRRELRVAARLYIELLQGTPLLMQLFLAFFGLSLFGLDVPAWLAAGLALILWASAFLAEIWRGCVESVQRGQWEASASLAMGYFQQMRHVILPQALRLSIPPTVGFSVQIVKSTALTSIIGFTELSKAGTIITNATFQPFTVYGYAALIYFALCWPMSCLSHSLERRLQHAADRA